MSHAKMTIQSMIGRSVAALSLALALFGQAARADDEAWPTPVEDDMRFGQLMADRLEYAWRDDSDAIVWDIQGWYGGDYRRLWVKSEGEDNARGAGGEFDIELLYSRLVAPFWDFQAGIGYQESYGSDPDARRPFLTVGFQGLAPYWFEVDTALRVSDDGDVSIIAEAEYDLLLTQRLVLQPRMETEIAAQEVPEFGVGGGITGVEIGLRLRYEVRREFAPYIGVSWSRKFGDTEDIARRGGNDIERFAVIAGIRMWY